MVQLLGSTSPKARNVAAQTLAKLIAAYPDARSVPPSIMLRTAAKLHCQSLKHRCTSVVQHRKWPRGAVPTTAHQIQAAHEEALLQGVCGIQSPYAMSYAPKKR